MTQYMVWSKKARAELALLISSMGLQACPVCDAADGLGLLHSPGIFVIGGFPWRPMGEPQRGNFLYMALVRCDRCGYSMMFDSEKFHSGDEPVLWTGPGEEPDPPLQTGG